MSTTQSHEQTRILVQAAAAACEDKKGEDTRILELDPIDSGLSDFFLITSATNDRQAIAIADEIEYRLKKDYIDFVAHVFLTERRAFYDIERLRKSARPLTPSQFDAELTEALSAKTRAARESKPAKKTPQPKPKKTTSAKPAAKKRAAVKSAAKKPSAKSATKR